MRFSNNAMLAIRQGQTGLLKKQSKFGSRLGLDFVRLYSSSKKELPYFDYEVEKLYDTNYLNVPTLPLPPVENTLKRYLETVRPHATPEEFKKTCEWSEDFAKNYAPALHQELIEMTSKPGYPYSYIETFWDEMYQAGRWEVMVNSNPFYYFPNEKNPADQDQTLRAAKLASACLRWWNKVVDGKLEADMERGKPLCMYGHGLVFGATRVPAIGRDTMETNFKRNHIIVIAQHRYFKVDVISPEGKAIAPEKLKAILDEIKSIAAKAPGDVNQDVGVLTAGERDRWATLRKELIAGPAVNKESLDIIDDCLFTICLDDNQPNTIHEISNQMLHNHDGTNRWWDKHNIIALPDGDLGFNFDHTFGDGLTWNRMLGEAWADIWGNKSGYDPLPAASSDFTGSFKPLSWDLPSSVASVMEEERKKAKAVAQDVDTHVLKFDDYGRNRMKEMKMSPDAVAQMAFQLAYTRLHGVLPGVYESCAMKNFFHGRTETIRSATNESLAMTKAFLNDGTDDEKRSALAEACRVHVEVAKGAKSASGPYQGVDRHLHAMKCVALRKGMNDIPFYVDPMYSKSCTWTLSTSNVTAPFINIFGFGAVTGHGYGLGYMTQPDYIPVNITSFKSNPETNSEKMGQNIAQSLRDFDKLFK